MKKKIDPEILKAVLVRLLGFLLLGAMVLGIVWRLS